MSYNIPFDIQVEIITRLPVKSLIQFRSVSKAWNTLIHTSDFIARYSVQHTQPQHLLASYEDSVRKYVSIVDDNTFPQHKVSLIIHPWVNMLTYCSIVCSSDGLLCLYGVKPDGHTNSGTGVVVLWNPSIRKTVAVVLHDIPYFAYATVLGFHVCRETIDPKIVRITRINIWSETESEASYPWQVEVFTLSTGFWRSSFENLPRKSVIPLCSKVFIDEILYFLAKDWITLNDGFSSYSLVISFDMTNENFEEVNLPDKLAHKLDYNLSLSKLRESLVVLEHDYEADTRVYGVWAMDDCVSKSFTKLYTVTLDATIRGFRKSGEPVIEVREHHGSSLAVYDLNSKHISNLRINGDYGYFYVCHHMETLLLLDEADFSIYVKGGKHNFSK